MDCKVCSHADFHLVIEREYPRHLICKNCGFTFMEDMKLLHDYYEDDYWATFHGITGLFNLNEKPIPKRSKDIFSLLKPFLKEGAKCLEIGAGFGHTINHIRNNSKSSVFALEPSKEGCQNMRHNNIPCFQGSLEELKIVEKFDVIIMAHVFEHFRNPIEAISLLKGLITDTGIIYVEVPNLLQPEFHKNLKFWFSKEHYYYYTLNKLRFFFLQNGFANTFAQESSVIKTLFVLNSLKQEFKYTREYLKVIVSLKFHDLMYYPARLVRLIAK